MTATHLFEPLALLPGPTLRNHVGNRGHHIGRFNPSDAMLRRIRSDLEENMSLVADANGSLTKARRPADAGVAGRLGGMAP